LPPWLRPIWPYAKRVYTAGTRAVAPVTMRLDARRGGWLPHSVAASTAAALAVPGNGVEHPVAPGEVIEREPPTGVPAELGTLRRQVHAAIRPQVVLELPDGRVLGPHRALLTRDGALLHEEVRYFGTTRGIEHPVFLQRHVDPPADYPGTVAVLATRGDANYYHFLHDVVPRLSVLERCATVPAPERYYVPTRLPFQRELLELAGVPADRIIDADAVPHLRAERLLWPRVPDLDLNHPAWAVQFLRDRLLPRDAELVAGRRVYVTRGRARHSRIVRNEDEVLATLADRFGFVAVDPATLSVADQIRTFAAAETIVAPHGAALGNLAFAHPEATVVELFPPDYVQGCYWKISTCVRMNYRYLVGSGRVLRHRESQGVASDIELDLASLIQMVESVVARADRR
jgi:capsular polysaccharide biosynthesis protein